MIEGPSEMHVYNDTLHRIRTKSYLATLVYQLIFIKSIYFMFTIVTSIELFVFNKNTWN